MTIAKIKMFLNQYGYISRGNAETIRNAVLFINDGPVVSGSFKETVGMAFPTSETWYMSSGSTERIFRKEITRDNNQIPQTIKYIIYNDDGTIYSTVTDNYTYVNNIFEVGRTRIYEK